VPRVEYEKLSDDRLGEPSAAIRQRVEAARARLTARRGNSDAGQCGTFGPAKAGPGEVRDFCRLDEAGKSLLNAAMQQHPEGPRMSARAYHRILKLARTMARKAGLDLAGSDGIQTAHLAEAIQYRPRRQT
jgi:magnesium chelatase family protein